MRPSLVARQTCRLCVGLLFLIFAAPTVYGQSACDSAAQTLKQIHEKLANSSTSDDLDDILQQLKYATGECPNNGDAWYYRAKVEEKLKKPQSDIDYSMRNARRLKSIALAKNIDPFGSAAPSNSGRPNPPATANRDTTGPRIRIISPSSARGQGVSSGSKIAIVGEATDESGVSEVSVLGQPAQLDASGRFSAEARLKVGENKISIVAIDIFGNRTEDTITIKREETPAAGTNADAKALPGSAGRYYALLIGVEKYQDRRITQLDNPLKDVRRLVDVLTSQYTFEASAVIELRDPTRSELFKAFEDLRDKLTPNDQLLLFYAGHGDWNADKDQGYWLPSDAESRSSAQWFSNSDLRDQVKGIKAKHILLITDACFAGGLFKERSIPKEAPTAIQEIFKLSSRKAITSGALKTVPDKSVFIEYLLKRLTENQDDYLPALRLFANMREAVINNSPNQQTPLYGVIQGAGDEGGDFVFVRRR